MKVGQRSKNIALEMTNYKPPISGQVANLAADLIDEVIDGKLSAYSALEKWPFPMERWPLPLAEDNRTFVDAWTELTHYADDEYLRNRDAEYAIIQHNGLVSASSLLRGIK